MIEVEFIGTGNAGQVPVWGCQCRACLRAITNPVYRRGPCSLAIRTPLGVTLIDAGRTDLAERYAFDDIHRIILTHFHMDHVQGLFHLRWSERSRKIPVFRPNDPLGADDLYKHPGVLEFQEPFIPFNTVYWPDFSLTALPLNHSKITLGYLLQKDSFRLAYLTDTIGLPESTEKFLLSIGSGQLDSIDYLIVDCSEPPHKKLPKNHNDFNEILHIYKKIRPNKMILTHISHRLDCWLLENASVIPNNMSVASDGMTLTIR
ncbi:MAG: phosphonate metabolism protein PhnP [Pseudomonadales bacterium]